MQARLHPNCQVTERGAPLPIDVIQFSTGAASGGAGAATATGYSPTVSGRVLKARVEYDDSPPGTTDLTLSDDQDPASESIVSLSNNNSDTTLYPRRKTQDNAGNNVTFDGTNEIYEPYVVHGRLEATIAQANNNDSATVTVWLEK